MEISLSKLLLAVTGIAIICMIGYAGYFIFGVFFNGPSPDPITAKLNSNNILNLSAKYKKAATVLVDSPEKVSLDPKKDLQFLDSKLYHSFTVLPTEVPPSRIRGRENPFAPYVTP